MEDMTWKCGGLLSKTAENVVNLFRARYREALGTWLCCIDWKRLHESKGSCFMAQLSIST